MKKWRFLLILMLLWHPPLSLADTSTSTQASPRITIQDPGYQFDPAIEGDAIIHEFTIANDGTVPLEILKIETG